MPELYVNIIHIKAYKCIIQDRLPIPRIKAQLFHLLNECYQKDKK